jgi:DNA-binding PadR family transcriptional regulator
VGETLGNFEQAVLLAIVRLKEDAYGRAVLREVQERLERDIAAGAVHATLVRLEGQGLISSRIGIGTPIRDGRDKRFYRLQPAGIAALNDARAAVKNLWHAERDVPMNETLQMLQTVLTDRFKLVFHRETKSVTGYTLLAGNFGSAIDIANDIDPSFGSFLKKFEAGDAGLATLAATSRVTFVDDNRRLVPSSGLRPFVPLLSTGQD